MVASASPVFALPASPKLKPELCCFSAPSDDMVGLSLSTPNENAAGVLIGGAAGVFALSPPKLNWAGSEADLLESAVVVAGAAKLKPPDVADFDAEWASAGGLNPNAGLLGTSARSITLSCAGAAIVGIAPLDCETVEPWTRFAR